MAVKVAITGNTYQVKEALKAIGARWDADQKAWMVDEDKAEQARKIVEGGSSQPAQKKSFVHYKCVVCGAKASRYAPIYKSGECRDCYEERKMGY